MIGRLAIPEQDHQSTDDFRWRDKKFRAKAVSFPSLMVREPTTQLADAHGSATPRPPETVRPAATPEEPSVAASRDVILPVAGRSRHQPSFSTCVIPAHVSLTKSPAPDGRAWTLPSVTAVPPPSPSAYPTRHPHSCARQTTSGRECVRESVHNRSRLHP